MTKGSMTMTPRDTGFTLIELLVVMAVIGLLLSLAVPRYMNSVDRSKEAVLRENLAVTRQALDRHYEDLGKYPDGLEALVARKYLRSLPLDPIAGNNSSWILVAPDTPEKGGVYNIKSGAAGNALDGTPYQDW